MNHRDHTRLNAGNALLELIRHVLDEDETPCDPDILSQAVDALTENVVAKLYADGDPALQPIANQHHH